MEKENKVLMTVNDGTDINIAIEEAIAMSKEKGMPISFDFNGQEVTVDQSSTFETTYKNWANTWEQSGNPIRIKMPNEMTKGFNK